MAHGQATRRTARLLSTARPGSPTTSHQVKKVTTAPMSTAGTNTLLIRSAIRCNGALSLCASSTRRCRWAKYRFVGDGRDRDDQYAVPVPGPTGHEAPGPAIDRQRLSGEHRLVDRRPSGKNGAVEGDGLARPDPDEGSHGKTLRRYQHPFLVLDVHDHPRRGWSQREQGVHRLRCPCSRPHFDGTSGRQDGHDQRGHHSVQPGREGASATEVHVPTAKSDGLDRTHPQRGQRSQSDERVHAGRPVPKQPGAVPQEWPASDDLHDDGENQDGPSGRRRLGTGQRDQQGQYGQWPGDEYPEIPMVRIPIRFNGMAVDYGSRGVARIADGVAQGFGIEPGGIVGDVGPGGGQIDRGACDGGQASERPSGCALHRRCSACRPTRARRWRPKARPARGGTLPPRPP